MSLEQQLMEVAPTMNKEVIRLLQAEITNVWTFARWGFGICATGFFVLCGWIWWLARSIGNSGDLKEDVDKIVTSIEKIEHALIGDYDKKGLITKQHEQEKELEKLKEKVEQQNG